MTIADSGSRLQLWKRRAALFGMGVLLLAGIFLVMVQVSPWYVGLNDDSGLFAYGGQRILAGDLLYRDIWDTKPPGVFYLDALALSIGGVSPWAIWWFQVVWLGLTTIVLLLTLEVTVGGLSAFLATGLMILTALHPSYFQGGNLTEVYALLPQVLALAMAVAYFRSGRLIWIVALGIDCAAALLLKPTYIALPVTALGVATLMELRRGSRKRTLSLWSAFLPGLLIPLIFVAGYWAGHGALADLWEAVFLQNAEYVQAGFSLRGLYTTARMFLVNQPLAALTALSVAAFAHFAIQGGLGSLRRGEVVNAIELRGNRSQSQDFRTLFFLVVFVALPVEAVFVALSGRNFGHYFITPLPAMSAAGAYLISAARSALPDLRSSRPWFGVSLATLGVVLGGWAWEVAGKELPERAHLVDLAGRSLSGAYWMDELERYVIEHTEPSQAVLVWGYNPGLHFLTGRRAPSRYLFHAQLLTLGGGGRFNQFLADLDADPPVLILASTDSPHGIPYFGSPEASSCPDCTQEGLSGLNELAKLVEQEYMFADQIDDWLIFQRRQ